MEIKDKHGHQLWKVNSENARRQITEVQRGGKTTSFGFDSKGMPTSIQASGIVNMTYLFDNDGNLNYRQDNLTNQKEMFVYDGMNRLTNWNIYQNNVLVKPNSIVYNATTGTITSKSDLGNFTMNYGENGKPHALTSIEGVPANFPTDSLNVTYTDFKKIKTLTEGNKHYILTCGIDDQRRKSEYKINGITQKTKYYLGDYEEETDNLGNIKKIHYLSGGAILINSNGVETLYYGYSDYQGNLIALANESGTVVERYAYDPWGKRRNPADWTQDDTRTSWIIDRGYTMHEHLDAFGIINMNGRVYDPLTAMFFSPDPYVQAPGNWLNYNRYGYAYGNPFKYVDPSGEIVWFIPVIYFVIYAGIEYGTQVYHNYQASNKMEELGFDPMSKKDIWFGRIDWFDVTFNGVGGAVSVILPPAAPWIMYGTPIVTNGFNWFGDDTKQSIFDGSIPIDQYFINTGLEVTSLYTTNLIKTGFATPQKDIWNPKNHTKYFSKEIFGKEITGRSIEDLFQQGIASWMDYTMKATLYPKFNPDRLFIDGIPTIPQTPNIPNPAIPSPYNPEFQRQNKLQCDYKNKMVEKSNDLEYNLRLILSPVR